MRHIRKRNGKFLVIDLKKNLVEEFDVRTVAELYQKFEGTIDEFWNKSEKEVVFEWEEGVFDEQESKDL